MVKQTPQLHAFRPSEMLLGASHGYVTLPFGFDLKVKVTAPLKLTKLVATAIAVKEGL
jgi:hypothetical protein